MSTNPMLSLEKLSKFIGREAIIQDFEQRLQESRFSIMFFVGEYGVGKTRLLHHICDYANKIHYPVVPDTLIDLYHSRHHYPEGLARAIVGSYGNQDMYFDAFYRASDKLSHARASGDSREARKQLQAILNGCANGLKQLSEDKGLLLLFDTAERWVYSTTGSEQFPPAWEWLKSVLVNIPKGFILFAGRPEIEKLAKDIELPEPEIISLPFFTDKETRDYLQAVSERYRESVSKDFTISDADIKNIYNLSEGRPILLSLYLELLQQDPTIREKIQREHPVNFEESIINYLMSLPGLGEIIKAVGRTPKGTDLELLSKILKLSKKSVDEDFQLLRQMSFTKTFIGSERVFLHDEMYALLNKYVYADENDVTEAKEAYEAIYQYYQQHQKDKTDALSKLYESLTRGVEFDDAPASNIVHEIRAIEEPRQILRTEFLYYRLRYQSRRNEDQIEAGLRMYYRYGHEAATSGNDEILMPLRIELSNFLLSLKPNNNWTPFLKGLLLLHSIWEKNVAGLPYSDDAAEQEKKLFAIRGLNTGQKRILSAMLLTWQGTGIVYSKEPDYDLAETIFTKVLQDLENSPVDEQLVWLRSAAISLTYRQRAYLRSMRGAYRNSIQDYLEGLKQNRLLDFKSEEATLRNDLGYVQMQIGEFISALENMSDGLRLRYQTALGPRISLSCASLSQYYIASGAYEEARKYARYAIKIAEAVGFLRGQAFGYLALAESFRRYALTVWGTENQEQFLRDAQDSIEIAIQKLNQISEKVRVVDAMLEQACLYRDRARLEKEPTKQGVWFQKANEGFELVAKSAHITGISYRQADALCNRVWLGYFIKDTDYIAQACKDFEMLSALEPYWLKDGIPVNQAEAERNPILWVQIAKYYQALAMIEIEKSRVSEENPKSFFSSARFMLLGMEYSLLFAPDHRGLREGRRTITNVLKSFNPAELKMFSEYILDVAKKEKIERKTGLQALMENHALWFTS